MPMIWAHLSWCTVTTEQADVVCGFASGSRHWNAELRSEKSEMRPQDLVTDLWTVSQGIA